jgi:hypothetical protein
MLHPSQAGLTERQRMKFNPYPLLLTTGALMLATVVFAQSGPTVSPLKAKVSVADGPATDEAHHPDTRMASLDREAADSGRALED